MCVVCTAPAARAASPLKVVFGPRAGAARKMEIARSRSSCGVRFCSAMTTLSYPSHIFKLALLTALWSALIVTPCAAQLTSSVSIAGKRSYDGFGDTFPGIQEVVVSVPPGSELLLVEMLSANLYCQAPSQCAHAAFAMQLQYPGESLTWYGPYLTFPTSSQSGTCNGSNSWTLVRSTGARPRSTTGSVRIQFYETFDDYPNLIDAQWNSGTIRVTYVGVDPSGACCLGATCTSLTQSQCSAAGGSWLGAGTTCSGTPCGTAGSLPVVTLTQLSRSTAYTAKSMSITPFQQNNQGASYTHPDSTPMNSSIGSTSAMSTASGSGLATQVSTIATHGFAGNGSASCESQGSGNGRGDGSGSSVFQANFTLDMAWVADVEWSVQAMGTSQTHATSIQLTRGTTSVISRTLTVGQDQFSGRINLTPGNYSLRLSTDMSATSGADGPGARSGSGAWSINLQLPVADCNSNGQADWQEIAASTFLDINNDGVLDACQCLADLDGDGIVAGGDLGVLLSNWGASAPTTSMGDLNGNGSINGGDLGVMLAVWGSCSN